MSDLISRERLLDDINKFAPEHYNALVNNIIVKQPSADRPNPGGEVKPMTNEEAIEVLRRVVAYESGFAEAKQIAIESLTDNDWVPCKERNPSVDGTYLVTYSEKMTDNAHIEEIGFDVSNTEVRKMKYKVGTGWIFSRHIPEWINQFIDKRVVAWRPLPECYKGGDTE